MREAEIIINGVRLTDEQSAAVRVALSVFITEIAKLVEKDKEMRDSTLSQRRMSIQYVYDLIQETPQ